MDLHGDNIFLSISDLVPTFAAMRPRLGIHLLRPDAKLSLKTFQVFIINQAFGSKRGK